MIINQNYIQISSGAIFASTVSSSPKFLLACLRFILIPVYEILIHPLFQRCLPNFNAFGKYFIGALLCFVWYTILLALITYARVHYIDTSTINSSSNATLSCLLNRSTDFLGDTLDYKWTILLDITWVASQQFFVIRVLQFVCAQVPYSMKGMVAGIAYGLGSLFMALSQAISLPFRSKSIAWSTGALSCSFWYLLTILVYMFIVSIGFAVAAKWYKRRKREDVLPNEHIFAEE